MGNDQKLELPGLGRLHFLKVELKLNISHRPKGVSISDNDVGSGIWFELKAGLEGLLFTDGIVLHATVESCSQKQFFVVVMVDVYVFDEVVVDPVGVYGRAWCGRL